MGQIGDFLNLYYQLVKLNVLITGLKSHTFVAFNTNLLQFWVNLTFLSSTKSRSDTIISGKGSSDMTISGKR